MNNVPIHTKVEVWNSFDHSYWCINFSLKHEVNENERTSEKGLWIKEIINRYSFFNYQWTQCLRSKDLSVLTNNYTSYISQNFSCRSNFKRKYWNYVRVFSELYLVQKTVLKIIFSLVALPNHSTIIMVKKKSFLFKINGCLILDNRLISILACHAEFK